MKPANLVRFIRKTPPSKPPVGEVDLKFDPASGSFVLIDSDGVSTPIGGSDLADIISLISGDPAATRASLGIVPQRNYMIGPDDALRVFRTQLDRGEDAACGFIGDSTYIYGTALPYWFATLLAARYPNHRVELFRAANDMQSIGRTVVQAGPLGRRYRYFPVGTTWVAAMPLTMAKTDMDGAAAISFEVEVAFDSGSLSSGSPSALCYLMTQGSSGSCTSFYINTDRKLTVNVQVSGLGSVTGLTSSVAAPVITAGTPVRYRVDFVANNGSNSTARFYYSTDMGVSYTEIGTIRTGTSATIGREGSIDYALAGRGTGLGLLGVKYYHAQVLLGLTRDPILPARIDFWVHFAGQTTNASYLGGSPTLWIDQAAQNGATISANGFFNGSAAGTFPTEAYRCWVNHGHVFVQINSAHNDTDLWGVKWETQMDATVTAILALYARKPLILHTTQNIEQADDGGELSLQFNRKQAWILQYAAKKGRGCTDVHKAFIDANDPLLSLGTGDVHPTDLGYKFWGRAEWDCFLSGTNTEFDIFDY